MVNLYGVVCPGCRAKVLLRVSVGLDRIQPFFFVCDGCGTPTNVRQLIEYKPAPRAWLELESGEQLNARGLEPDQVVNIHPELPSLPSAKDFKELGGSPFLLHRQILGDRLEELMSRIKDFRGLTDRDWVALKRLGGFYARRDWTRFDEEGARLLEEEWPDLDCEAARHDALNRLLQAMFMPFVVQRGLLDAVKEFASFLSTHRANRQIGLAFCREQEHGGKIRAFQEDLFLRFDFIVKNRSAFLSALPLEFYDDNDKQIAGQLRLFRDEFDILKLHYVDSYELGHQILALIVGFLNTLERGDTDSFDSNIVKKLVANGKGNFGRMADLAAFSRQSNAPKVAFLEQLPVLSRFWKAVFCSKLRNAMGHHDARHDLCSGKIVIGNETEMYYTDAALRSVQVVPMLLMLAHFLNMMATADVVLCDGNR